MGCRPDRRGMTLVEMMISLTLFAVIMGVVFTFLNNSRQTYVRTSERVQHQQSIRAVITLLTREIRSTGCDPSANGFDPFAFADDTSLQCRADLDGNGDILGNNPDEDVTYSYNGLTKELSRDGGAGAVVILREITNLTFSYFDEDGVVLAPLPLSAANLELIRFVDMDITGTASTGEEVNYSTRVLVRNG